MVAFALPLNLAVLAWPFATATLPADACDSGDRCSVSLLQSAQGDWRAATPAAPSEVAHAGGVEADAELLAGLRQVAEMRVRGAPELSAEQKRALETGNLEAVEISAEQMKAVEFVESRMHHSHKFHSKTHPGASGIFLDTNDRFCALCNAPFKERTDREYEMRTDCGNYSLLENPWTMFAPLKKSFVREATETKPATNAWCELNQQKMCADAIFNKDFLYQAKAVDYPPEANYDPLYCLHNGWLEPEVVALQHDFEGMKKKSEEMCNRRKYVHTKWNTTMTYFDMALQYTAGTARGWPTPDEAILVGGWTCAMGSSGCDMAYCAYSFCQLPGGNIGRYTECPGWDPIKGMPLPTAAQ